MTTVLTIETATPIESVGLVSGGELLAKRTTRAGRGHADRLLASVADVLESASLVLCDLDGIAVSIGPGRFTGLRVGLATAKGLSASTGLPVLPVPTLEALAASVPTEQLLGAGAVCAMLDARRGEVYFALFGAAPGSGRLTEDAALDPAAAARAAVEASNGAVVFAGTGASVYSAEILDAAGPQGRLAGPASDVPEPTALAAIADRVAAEGVPEAAALKPIYLRGL